MGDGKESEGSDSEISFIRTESSKVSQENAVKGEPFIPGSTLKGLFREMFCKIYGVEDDENEKIEYLKNKNKSGTDDFELVVFDLYDIIIDFLEDKNFMEKCFDFEKKKGLERITKAVSNSMKFNDDDSIIVQYIRENTPDNAVVFLTGIGKCYPILRSHKVLNNLHQAFVKAPVVMFFPGTYNEQELILFNEIKDDNYYRAFKLVK
mgnify:CR=1 FL=1